MINILIDKSGKTSKENIFLGNQHENLDETLHFLFPQEYKDYYKYITYSYSNNNQRVTGISPLVDDNFIVSSKITKISGIWELNLICKTSPVDLNDKVIDLTENNSSKEHIFISNTINACVSGNSIDVESFNNVAIDENIANLYDSILALKNIVEENDRVHEQNEAVRKANELERQEAENTRKANESERVSAEQLRVEAEEERKANEVKRQSNESARVETEKLRVNAENERTNAETERQQAEVARGAEENKRAEAETVRQSAETNRVNAENERVSAETLRKQAESARQENEESRKTAETSRVETENLRVSAESARENAEQSRISAESQRVTAEATRESAESARVEAESTRENAEQLRVNAENERVEAESNREGVINDLRNSVDQKITKFYASNQGETHIIDSDNGKIQDMMIYGKSSQDGTPSVENPIDIKSVVNPTIKVTNEDGLKVQSVILNNITLNAIPVSSGGNVTINGQQYIADYIDVERCKIVRMTRTIQPTEADDLSTWAGVKETVSNFRTKAEGANKNNKKVISNMLIYAYIWSIEDVVGTQIANNDSVDFTLPYSVLGIDKSATREQRNTAINEWLKNNDLMFLYVLKAPIEEDLTSEHVQKLKALKTYYPTTNISVNSEQLDGYTVFNYPVSIENGWNYVKKQLNDNRDYIYDVDMQSSEAYVNSEYLTVLTELGV